MQVSSRFSKIVVLFMAVVFAVTAFSQDAEARKRRTKKKKAKSKKAAVINEKKLYERIGGQKAMADIVDEWIRITLADQRISGYFSTTTANPEKLAKLRRGLNDQLCELADGPCQYKGPDMKKSHEGMKLGEEHYVAFAEDLFQSLQKFSVPEREKNELLGRLGNLKAEMLEGAPETP